MATLYETIDLARAPYGSLYLLPVRNRSRRRHVSTRQPINPRPKLNTRRFQQPFEQGVTADTDARLCQHADPAAGRRLRPLHRSSQPRATSLMASRCRTSPVSSPVHTHPTKAMWTCAASRRAPKCATPTRTKSSSSLNEPRFAATRLPEALDRSRHMLDIFVRNLGFFSTLADRTADWRFFPRPWMTFG